MVNEAKSSNRTLIIILAIAALLVAVAAVVAIVLAVGGGDETATGIESAASASVLPADTFMFISFNPNLDQAKNFEVIDQAWGDNPLIQQAMTELQKEMQAGDFDLQAEIGPWLGDEVSLAMGGDFMSSLFGSLSQSTDEVFEDITESLESGGDAAPSTPPMPEALPEMFIVAATTDQAASDQFLAKLRSYGEKDGTVIQESDYKGVQVVSADPQLEEDMGWAYATIDNLVIFAAGQDGLAVMQKAIDAQQSGANLASSTNYQDVLDKLPADQVGYGYMDMGSYMDELLSAAGPELEEMPTELFDVNALKAFKGMGFSAGFEPNGLRVDVVVTYDKDALPENMMGLMNETPNKAVGHVPADTLLYYSASGLGDVVQMILDIAESDPSLAGPEFEQSLTMIEGFLGVSVQDLIEMLSGEFALAVVYDEAGLAGDPSTPIGLSLLIEAREFDKYEKMLGKLANLLKSFAEMDIPTKTLNDVETWILEDPYSGEMMVGWGVSQDFFSLATSESLLEMAFGGGGAKLADNGTYQAAAGPLPKDKGVMLYINLNQLMDIAYETMSPWEQEEYDETARDIFAPIKAISGASESFNRDKSFTTSTLFILIESE